MNRFIALIGVVALGFWASAVQAFPTSGSNCAKAGCHGVVSGRANVTAPATTDSSVLGVPQNLPLFLAHPGDTILLPITATKGAGTVSDNYAVAMSGLASSTTLTGLLNGADVLNFTADPGWSAKAVSGLSYAYIGPTGWPTAATVDYSYALRIGAAAPDYYRVTLAAAGLDISGRWSQAQDVIVHVTAVPEPASLALIGLPVGLLLMRRRKLARAA